MKRILKFTIPTILIIINILFIPLPVDALDIPVRAITDTTPHKNREPTDCVKMMRDDLSTACSVAQRRQFPRRNALPKLSETVYRPC